MQKAPLKPIVIEYSENEWEFVYPPSIDNKLTYDKFWEGVEQLDTNDNLAEKIFKDLIQDHPYYIDAYNHLSLAFRNQNKLLEAQLTAEKAYNIGNDILKKNLKAKSKLPWLCMENRPFLRACAFHGTELQRQKIYSDAINVFKQILKLNENDNQGIRYVLLEIHLAQSELAECRKLFRKYKDDFSIEFKFGEVVVDVLEGKFLSAKKKLKTAIQTNEHLVTEIIKKTHKKPKPYRIPNEPFFDAGIPIGSVQEAFEYWERNKKVYKKKEVINFFSKMTSKS